MDYFVHESANAFDHSRNTGLPAVISCNESYRSAWDFLKCSNVTILVWSQYSNCGLTRDLYAASLVLGEQFLNWRRRSPSVLFDLVEIEFIWMLQSRSDVSSTPRYLWTRVGSSGKHNISYDINSDFFLCDMCIT